MQSTFFTRTTRGLSVVILASATLLLSHSSDSWAEDVNTAKYGLSDIALPALPCEIQTMAAQGSDLLLLDVCGTLVRWRLSTDEIGLILLEEEPKEFFEIAAHETGFAVLGDDRRTIYVYDLNGRFLRRHEYDGDSYLCRMAFLGEAIVASTYFDEHLLWVFSDDVSEATRLIENARYHPDLTPRFASHLDVETHAKGVVALDLLDFRLFFITPDLTVKTVHKVSHPLFLKHEQQEQTPLRPAEAETVVQYKGKAYAFGIAVLGDQVTAVMPSRALEREWELAATDLLASEWTRTVTLGGERYGSAQRLTALGDRVVLLNEREGVVHVAQFE